MTKVFIGIILNKKITLPYQVFQEIELTMNISRIEIMILNESGDDKYTESIVKIQDVE